ncbi:hypothetical protein ACFOJE_00525 [Azotobacter bryophylli]|uniref:Multidrug transporter n=1 Tax=Azotobacter bryophylli TaxID=1986537 RepID=A0ABV7AMS1_9GAMM
MLFGALLVLTWLVLLLRYPEQALRVSFAALCGLALVVAAVLWQEQRTEHALSRLELRLDYAPQRCPPDRPLAALRPGYRPETLDFRPVRLQGRFAD